MQVEPLQVCQENNSSNLSILVYDFHSPVNFLNLWILLWGFKIYNHDISEMQPLIIHENGITDTLIFFFLIIIIISLFRAG